jgi:hypothetical protein
MEILKSIWKLAPFWGPLVLIAAIVYAVWRVQRSRSASAPVPPAEAPSPDADPDALDSSHIGFAPLVGVLEPPYDRGGVAGSDAKQK